LANQRRWPNRSAQQLPRRRAKASSWQIPHFSEDFHGGRYRNERIILSDEWSELDRALPIQHIHQTFV
jgi:hypothetical protein